MKIKSFVAVPISVLGATVATLVLCGIVPTCKALESTNDARPLVTQHDAGGGKQETATGSFVPNAEPASEGPVIRQEAERDETMSDPAFLVTSSSSSVPPTRMIAKNNDALRQLFIPPSPLPSSLPTSAPSIVPSSPPTGPPPSGNGNGDPHFTTFSGKSFDYHGECDLVMMSSPAFASGSGLAVHVRTTRVDSPLLSYSYIYGAAVGIGKDHVMEVQVDGTLVINGRSYAAHQEEKGQKGANKDKDERDVSSSDNKSGQNGVSPVVIPDTFATYPLVKNMIGKKKRIVQYVLSLTDIDQNPITITIHANPRSHMLYVKIDGDINDSVGLLGHPHAGDRLIGRDGVKDMSQDWNAYGEEWQVRDFEPKLFQDEHRAPQYPSGCVYESHQDKLHRPKTNLRRRLLGGAQTIAITMEDATNACGDYTGVKKEHCVHDVMAMGDLEVADDPAYE